jgi:hypothetical protein
VADSSETCNKTSDLINGKEFTNQLRAVQWESVSEWVRVTARRVTPSTGAVTSSSQKPSVVKEEAPF